MLACNNFVLLTYPNLPNLTGKWSYVLYHQTLKGQAGQLELCLGCLDLNGPSGLAPNLTKNPSSI